MDILYQVTTSYFCCGVVVRAGRVIEAAPIMVWSVGKDWDYVRRWIIRKHGAILQVTK